MKISAFTLLTNATKFGYPFVESIKSWLPVVDELVIIDGGSTDGTLEMVKAIGDEKIRIIQDEDTKWEDDWSYSRMGKNFNRGYHECVGDIVIKFDADYILHEDAYKNADPRHNFKENCRQAVIQNALTIGFVRWNFVLVDRYFFKKRKTLAVNRLACKKRNIVVDYGLDNKRWGWGYEPVVPENKENDLIFGTLLGVTGNYFATNVKVFNYGFAFSTQEQTQWARERHVWAETQQQNMKYKTIKQSELTYGLDNLEKIKKEALERHIKNCKVYNKNRPSVNISIDSHPEIIRQKIRDLKPEQQGYNLWGNLEKAEYYA